MNDKIRMSGGGRSGEFMGEHELASKQICQQTPCFRRNAGKGKALASRERGTARIEVVVGVTQPLANEQPRLRLPESR